jgi:hypothetical protein
MTEKILHGYDGACAPRDMGCSWSTFSVGIFPILKKADGKGFKRGKSLVRVKGYISNSDAVYKEAKRIVDLLDAGEYHGPKNVTVGG